MKYIILSTSRHWINHTVSKIENLDSDYPIVSSGNTPGMKFSLDKGIKTSSYLNKVFNKIFKRFYKLKILE